MSTQIDSQDITDNLPEGLVSQLIAHTEDLTSIIREEMSILDARRPAEITSLQAEKGRLSAIYVDECNKLKQNQTLLGEKDSPLRLRLREVTEIFNAELVRLGRTLLRMKSVTEGMVGAIAEEVAKKRQTLRSYAPNAIISESSVTAPLPIAMNEVI